MYEWQSRAEGEKSESMYSYLLQTRGAVRSLVLEHPHDSSVDEDRYCAQSTSIHGPSCVLLSTYRAWSRAWLALRIDNIYWIYWGTQASGRRSKGQRRKGGDIRSPEVLFKTLA